MSRSCGECSACCYTHSVKALGKNVFTPCSLVSESGGCSIYETRPRACGVFRCSWLTGEIGEDHDRPDKVGIVSVIALAADKRISLAEVFSDASKDGAGKHFVTSLQEDGWHISLFSDNSETSEKISPLVREVES